jgi:hypothetical protein
MLLITAVKKPRPNQETKENWERIFPSSEYEQKYVGQHNYSCNAHCEFEKIFSHSVVQICSVLAKSVS